PLRGLPSSRRDLPAAAPRRKRLDIDLGLAGLRTCIGNPLLIRRDSRLLAVELPYEDRKEFPVPQHRLAPGLLVLSGTCEPEDVIVWRPPGRAHIGPIPFRHQFRLSPAARR